jgi:hypothetical protein
MSPKMSLRTSARLLAVFLAVSGAALSGGRGASHEFDDIVKAIERHYGTHRTHIPLMGVANLVTKVARPAGASGFKLAIFEDLKDRPDDDGPAQLDQFMSGLTVGGMHPLVREHSRRGEEATYIYAGEVGQTVGQTIRLLIATFEPKQATVIEVNVSMRILLQLLQSPNHAASMFGQ